MLARFFRRGVAWYSSARQIALVSACPFFRRGRLPPRLGVSLTWLCARGSFGSARGNGSPGVCFFDLWHCMWLGDCFLAWRWPSFSRFWRGLAFFAFGEFVIIFNLVPSTKVLAPDAITVLHYRWPVRFLREEGGDCGVLRFEN